MKKTQYTIDLAIADAVRRAAREQGASIAVYSDEDDIYIRALPAIPPERSRLRCVAQFWSETEHGDLTVQVRYPGGESEFRSLMPHELSEEQS